MGNSFLRQAQGKSGKWLIENSGSIDNDTTKQKNAS